MLSDNESVDVSLVKKLLHNDFKRLERLLALDLPGPQIEFDFDQINEFTRSIMVEIPQSYYSVVADYLIANCYSVVVVNDFSDDLLKVNALSQVLEPGTTFNFKGSEVIFESFGTKYRGHIDESPGKPGLHHDFSVLNVRSFADEKFQIKTSDVSYEENQMLFEELDDFPNWKLDIIENHSFIGPLPPVKFYEGDVVELKSNPGVQHIVFRIVWHQDRIVYQLRDMDKKIIEADDSSINLCTNGVARLYYNGTPPIRWKDIKNEAEYYLLLGLFTYHYNPLNNSYRWGLDQARNAIRNDFGHAILNWKNAYFLISFTHSDNGSLDPEVVSEHTLSNDLILSF
ncbi:hypothetical protein C4588_05625 [Candidatus Parcubacteria bacterium]|nr:MAG: hypothetical protein C4588_05625 [Candidatus Parcubacteria bacterium]